MVTMATWLGCAHPVQQTSESKGGATPPTAAPAAAGTADKPAGGGQKVEVAERATVDPRYQWRVADLYADLGAWRTAKEATVKRFAEVRACQGKLGTTPELERCLKLVFDVGRELRQINAYANRVADQDTRIAANAALKGETQKILAEFGQAAAFVEPELLALEPAKLQAMITAPELAAYRHFLDNVARQRPHTLGRAEEELLAQAGLLGSVPENVYDIFTGSDLKFGTMTDSAGREVAISTAMYMRYRSSTNREDRRKIFDGFWATYRDYQNTFATLLSSQLNRDLFFAKSRRYPDTLSASLDSDNIPEQVYTTMIKSVNEQMPLLHRYLGLRQRLLGVDKLYYHDMYPSLLQSVTMPYTYDEAVQEVAEALGPLGPEYLAQIKQGMAPGNGWVDVFPSKGKRTGAYMSGEAYGVHPYVLLNFDNSYDDVSTLAHEMGHAMHSHLTNSHQPVQYADYSTFIAEIASTFNETLLVWNVLAKTKDRDRRLYLLGEYMENFRTVVFRQAMFAEFELATHKLAETGASPTAEDFNRIYRELLERYYGQAQGVTVIQDRDQVEWAYIPHFYYNYYVYAYVTGFIAATALADAALTKGQPAVDAYLGMLAGGSSKYPLELLRDAGVDMTSPEPYRVAMKRFAETLDEVDRLTRK